MAGMLTEGQQPSSGPGATPPAASPGAGIPPRGEAPGPERSQTSSSPEQKPGFEQLRDEAVQLVYGDRFDKLIEMFETNGAEKFPRSMAVAINTAISALEQKYGESNHILAAKVGTDLMMKLIQDIVGQKVLPDVTLEQIQEALPATMQMYADSHPDVSQQDIQTALKAAAEGSGAGGAPQSGEVPAASTATSGPEGAMPTSPPTGSIPAQAGGPQ